MQKESPICCVLPKCSLLCPACFSKALSERRSCGAAAPCPRCLQEQGWGCFGSR